MNPSFVHDLTGVIDIDQFVKFVLIESNRSLPIEFL